MKFGTSTSISKLNEVKNNKKKENQMCMLDEYDLSDVKSSFTDVMKVPTKKRVPFVEILNQEEEEEIQSHKVYKKSSIGFIPNKKNDVIYSCPKNAITKNKEIEVTKTDKYTEQGKDSIQLISVIESVTISSRSNDKQSLEIYEEKTYHLEINEEAVKKLFEIQSNKIETEEINICAAVGKTKTGKSFLLNKLINLSQSEECPTFSVNHTLSSCTKGIWISNQPINVSKNDSKKSMLILDTAGFGSYDSTQETDYKLLTLSILLSDVLMYNSIGPIDEQMLNGMSLAVEISKLISQEQQKSETFEKIFTFPALFWVLRDFSLELLTKENKKITEEDYLEKCLNLESHQKNYSTVSSKTKSKTNIREAVKSIFTNRKCSTLVTPFDEQGEIRTEFIEGLSQVKNKLFTLASNSQKKTSNNKEVNKIEEFIIKLRAFVELLNNEDSQTLTSSKKSFSFPKIESLETSLNKVKLLHEFKKINEEYEKLFKKYEENIEKVQETVDSKEKYFKKVEKLREKMENEINETRNSFKGKIERLLNLKNSLTEPEVEKNIESKTSFKLNFAEFEKDLSKNDDLFKVVKENYEIQCDTLRQKFEQIELKIMSYRSNQSEEEETILSASKMVDEKIESFREINSITELKKVFEKTLNDLKSLFRESQDLKEMKKLEKELEVHYLNQKVNLMESSHLQLSNQSNFEEFSKLKTQGYEKCANCEKSFYIPYIIIPSSDSLNIKFLKTIVKEMHREYTEEIENTSNPSMLGNELFHVKKMKLEFIIEVELNNKKWFMRRKFKDFIELNNIISIMFIQEEDNMVYPSIEKSSYNKNTFLSSLLKLSSMSIPNDFSEEKARKTKQELEAFLIQLKKLDYVRNSRIFQKFVKINKEYLDL